MWAAESAEVREYYQGLANAGKFASCSERFVFTEVGEEKLTLGNRGSGAQEEVSRLALPACEAQGLLRLNGVVRHRPARWLCRKGSRGGFDCCLRRSQEHRDGWDGLTLDGAGWRSSFGQNPSAYLSSWHTCHARLQCCSLPSWRMRDFGNALSFRFVSLPLPSKWIGQILFQSL